MQWCHTAFAESEALHTPSHAQVQKQLLVDGCPADRVIPEGALSAIVSLECFGDVSQVVLDSVLRVLNRKHLSILHNSVRACVVSNLMLTQQRETV